MITDHRQKEIARVLIYRLGSLGDTVVALPCFHLIARAFPNAQRWVLTSRIPDAKASAISSVLENSDLIHGQLDYSTGLRSIQGLIELRAKIRGWNPQVLIYLTEPRGRYSTLRDLVFFLSCGITNLIGVPYNRGLAQPLWLPARQVFEPEAERLARCLASLGDARLADSESWNLRLTAFEIKRAQQVLATWPGRDRYIVCSVGARIHAKDWGGKNWIDLLERVSQDNPELGLVLIGAKNEFERSEAAWARWKGPALNLCGKLSPRESAAILQYAQLFVGHDSGPMHLAAAVSTPCVAIFSARNKPAVWFPYGPGHQVLYHQTECYGCGLEVCTIHNKKCIHSIQVSEALARVQNVLDRSFLNPKPAFIQESLIA